MLHRIKSDLARQSKFLFACLFLCGGLFQLTSPSAEAPAVGQESGIETRFWQPFLTLFTVASPLRAPAVVHIPENAAPVDPAAPAIHILFLEKFPSLGEIEVRELSQLFLKLCRQYNFSPALVLGLIHVESDFQPKIESFAGAVGLMQVLPSTGEPIARELGLAWRGKETLWDPKANLQIGFHYLNSLRQRFNGISQKYVTAYNWGPNRVGYLVQNRRQLPLDYYRKVERQKQQYAFVDGPFAGL